MTAKIGQKPNFVCTHCGKAQLEDRDAKICEMWEFGIVKKEIIKRFNVSPETITRVLRRHFHQNAAGTRFTRYRL